MKHQVFLWNIHDYGYNDDTLIYISHLHKNNPNIPILPLYIVYFENISAFCKYHHFPFLATALVELLRAQYLLYLEATQFFISSASSFKGRLFWKRSFLKLFILVHGPMKMVHIFLTPKYSLAMAICRDFCSVFFFTKWQFDLFLRFGQKWKLSKEIRICANT